MKHFYLIFTLFFIVILNAQKSSLKGIVYLDKNNNGIYDSTEKGLSNVLISNGKEVVSTDFKGRYKIKTIANNSVFIIKPTGYISKLDEQNTVNFYVNSSELKQKKIINFPLYNHPEKNTLKIALLGDLQVDVMDDIYHVGKLVTEELALTKPDFIIPLGDLSFDNLNIFQPLSKTLGLIGSPIFYVIGNHDLNFGENSLQFRDDTFEKNFGPSYYAFEYGKNLFLVINNIYPLNKKEYEGKIDKEQMEFLKQIIKYKSKKFQSINIFMHIPLEELVNKNELINILQPFKDVFIASGHTHTQYHKYHKRDNASDIHELVAGAVCGSWWQGSHDIRGIPFAMMYDGTPKGYWLMDVNSSNSQLTYKVSGAEKNKQMDIWVPEINEWDTELNKLNEPFVYSNVFAADSFTNVEINFGTDTWVSMEKYNGISPEVKRFYALQELGRYTSQKISRSPKPKTTSKHLWRIKIPQNLSKGAHLINIKATNSNLKLNVKGNRVLWIQ